ncbi:MAG: lipid-binding SYLF domain-containing protein [Candidatus Omnitrophica bacterium]|nr:lipid-binding SYLF domain-containing protein [Candidatus Omnitrophota bacterium]
MKKFISCCLVIMCVISLSTMVFGQDKWDNLLVESAKVFEEMTEMPELGIPSGLLRDCYAIAIFPNTIEGGFIIGAQYAQGVIIAKDKKTGAWSAPAVFNLKGGSFGWQVGGQATDNILLIMSERGLDGLLRSKFKLGADAGISAGPLGRDVAASTDAQLKGGILSYSRSRGAFIGLKLDGSVVTFNKKANKALYGKGKTADEILIKKSVKPTSYSDRLMKNLRKY